MNDGSLQTGTKQFAFDLDSQKGVTILLASLRSAEITTAQKNELRDLVFLYSNGGKDESVRITIEQKITTYGIVPMVSRQPAQSPEPTAPVKPKLPFGTSRPAPSFTPSFRVATIESVVSKPAPVVTPAPQPVAVPTPAPEPEPEPEVKPVAQPLPVMESEAVVQTPEPFISAAKPEPVVEPLPAPAPVFVPEPTPTPAPVPPPQPIVSETNTDSTKNLDRIREIKSLVNDKVGNPVNLVDIDNEVGREYMGALLDAMKKLNSGTSTISAMKRLEASFIEVQKTLEKHDKEKSEPKDEPVPVVTPAPEPEPVAAPTPELIPEIKTNLSPAFSPAPQVENQSVDKNEQTLPLDVKPVVEFSLTEQPEPIKEDTKPLATFAPKIEKTELEPSEKLSEALEDSRESAWANIDAKDEAKPEPRIPIARVASLADIKNKPASIDNLKSSSAIETSSVSGDPLFTKQVDDGLNQLLQEWSIFKKSGLFGTGPKGSEHPLFKKISALQIPLLLAGRFEGATQEIKQSITDYMNGWRYEQGIIYEQGETFEHYLRRVIRHILDLQKNK